MNHESTSVDEIRDRLRQHFADTPEVERNQKWSQLWENGFVPWDRGRPNPALEDALADQAKPLEAPSSDEAGSRRKRALVPGCGKGYDVLLLASFGYDAYGLEVSPMAVEQCREFAREHAGEYPPRNLERGSGRAVFILGDFFEDGWLGEADGASAFDLIYDYTFLCIFPPILRPKWSLRHSQLLSKDRSSRLVCVEFPTTKPPSLKGPPFGVAPKVYLGHLNRPGEQLPYDDEDDLLEHEMGPRAQDGLVRVAHWQPERTHAIGKDTDWISVWRRA